MYIKKIERKEACLCFLGAGIFQNDVLTVNLTKRFFFF